MQFFKKTIFLIFLVLIILLAIFLRFTSLDSNPSGFYVDEASSGYNAYSILLTGKDEYGMDFPFAFRFFGSYTPPVYTYLTAMVIKFFDLSIFSTRFLSATSGVLVVFLFFLFVRDLVSKRYQILIIGGLLMVINPWSLFYSRVGYEVHLAFLIYSTGVYCLWKALENKYLLILGFGFLSLSGLTYHAERLLVPLVLLVYFFIYRKELQFKRHFKIIVSAFAIYFLISLPQILIFSTPANTSRGLGLFYSQVIINQAKSLSYLPDYLSIPIVFLREFSAQYISYFSPRNLFSEGDFDLQRSIPEVSVFYPWMLVFFVIGIFVLAKNYSQNKSKFIILLLMLSPVPAALTADPFSTQRALPMLLPILLIMVIGIYRVLKSNYKWFGILFIAVVIPFSLLQLYRSYAVLLPNERANNWGYGFSQLIDEVKKRPNTKFVIDDTRMKPVYIEALFFLKYPPEKLHKVVDQSIRNNYYTNTRWDSHYKFGQIETRAIKWENDIYKEQILVGDELSISKEQVKEHFLTEVFIVLSPTDEIIFRGYQTNPDIKRQYEEKARQK